MGVTLVITIAAAATWNFHRTQNEVAISDLTLDNLNAMATGRGNFPACQKTVMNSGDKATIPFCVNGTCKQVEQYKYKLDVNYCSENPR